MKITLNLELDQEHSDALDQMVAESNAADGRAITAKEYLTGIVMGPVKNRVEANFRATVKRLGDAAALLPYAERNSIAAVVEEKIASLNPPPSP